MKGGESGFHGKNSSKIVSPSNSTATQPAPSASCTKNVRVEWNNMAEADKLWYVQSARCLMDAPPLGVWAEARSIWDEMAWVHDYVTPGVHRVDVFLPWHRYFIHLYKTLLAGHCAYTGPIPWLRESNYAGNFAGSGAFQPKYFGSLPPLSDKGEGTCITDGPFANTTVPVGPNAPSCLSRGENKEITANATMAAVELCHGDANTRYTQHRRCVERTIHATGHVGIGPTMSLFSTSPGDPAFFLHHGFVDWQWKRWQDADGARSTSVSGCVEYPEEDSDDAPCVPMTRDTVLTSMGLVPDLTVGDVIDTENDILCYTYDEF
ncbi:tyrosinase-like protein [Chaetomium fimeti]|uniref:Tyrosinase-like protein n=1 Tax=Chaetomium fimeti TaxID=1854472 RepID=A0AAE0HBZ5_9PEZI|nr:tyrosinase-like protein [Chaetomium fimeti]